MWKLALAGASAGIFPLAQCQDRAPTACRCQCWTRQAKRLTGWWHSSTYQQTGCLKPSWVHSCLRHASRHGPATRGPQTQLYLPVGRIQLQKPLGTSCPIGNLCQPLDQCHPPRGRNKKTTILQPAHSMPDLAPRRAGLWPCPPAD